MPPSSPTTDLFRGGGKEGGSMTDGMEDIVANGEEGEDLTRNPFPLSSSHSNGRSPTLNASKSICGSLLLLLLLGMKQVGYARRGNQVRHHLSCKSAVWCLMYCWYRCSQEEHIPRSRRLAYIIMGFHDHHG
eukprot:scaffold11142_cov37-Attheya_sp.AAC.3